MVDRYVLEEDTDEIELIELTFGKDGKRLFIAGPYDNANRTIATLERKLGAGNFDYFLNPGF
jgi:hypothetical protein